MTRIAIIDGHPDPDRGHFVHALAEAYAEGAIAVGHEVRRINIAELDFPIIGSRKQWEEGEPPPDIARSQETVVWAEHLVLVYPLWLGDVPARMKGFLEQLARPHFAFRYRSKGFPEKLLTGRSARVLVTMGMPGLFYRLFYRAHSLKSLERNILRFCGLGPVRHRIFGTVEGEGSDARRQRWLREVRRMGARAG